MRNLMKSAWAASLALAASMSVTPTVSAYAADDSANAASAIPKPHATQSVTGGGGVQIAVQEWGNPDGPPVVFIHALVSSHLGYLPIVAQGPLAENFRLITFDNRGHGNSEKPTDMAAYQDGGILADDLAAVIGLAGDQKPIVVAWSIGGVILGDYLAKYGDDAIAGAVYLGAGHTLGEAANPYIGGGFAQYAAAMMSPDIAVSVPATIAVSMANTAKPLPPDLFTFGVATAMVVPPQARAGLVSRSVNHISDTLPSVNVPIRFLHGTADQIVQPVSSVDAAAAAPNGEYVAIEGIGHAPSFEAPAEVISAILAIAKAAK
ncbi:MAG: alpha/beta hydrolase [Pseudomonadota bacterium]